MSDINFYHLVSTSLDQALPKLLEKSLQAGFRVQLRVPTEEEAERLNGLLWTYNPDSFLPHGTAKDGYGEEQPVFITASGERPNSANLLVITGGMRAEDAGSYDRVLDIFNGADDEQVATARERWKQYGTEGHKLTYVRQTPTGGWEKQGA